jgi:phage-related protein
VKYLPRQRKTDLASNLYFYRDDDGSVPVLDWLDKLDKKVRMKVYARFHVLKAFGHDLRRPLADYLRDGIYELRINVMGVQFRVLYFFSGLSVVILSHGLRKIERVPPREIDKAIERKMKYESDREAHALEVTL